jgi:hypothetical protein
VSVFVDFLDKLPPGNAVAVGQMLNQLSEDNAGFIEDYLTSGVAIPSNIISHINGAFKAAGYPQYNWNNCQMDMSNKRFDGWFDDVSG